MVSMEGWQGKIAVVTGASAGMGAAIAVELVKHGLKVVAVARREENINALQSKLTGTPGKLYPRKGDVSKEEDINALFQWVKENFGTIHVLVNNAGIVRPGKLVEQKSKYWREILDLNVVGLSICTQQAIKLMRDTGVDDGHIIHISSSLSHGVPNTPNPSFAMYPASKFAVRALTETLRQELRHLKSKIRISSISPGQTDSEFGAAGSAGLDLEDKISGGAMTLGGVPPPKLQSQDVADAVLYVLSTPPHVQVHELFLRANGGI